MSLVADYSSDSDSDSNSSLLENQKNLQRPPLVTKKQNVPKRIIKLDAIASTRTENEPDSKEVQDAPIEKKSTGFSISSLLPPPKNRIKSKISEPQSSLIKPPNALQVEQTEPKSEPKEVKKVRKQLFSIEPKHPADVSLRSPAVGTNDKKSGPSFSPSTDDLPPASTNIESSPPPSVTVSQQSSNDKSSTKQRKRRSSFNGVNESEKEILDFNVDQFYQANIEQAEELEAQSGLKTRIKAVGAGKHQLSSLIKSAKQNQQGLEELHARSKRAKTQAGAKYGFY